jgi:hypothetical protein
MGERKSDKKFVWNEKDKTLTVESHNSEVFTAEQLKNIWSSLEGTKSQIEGEKANMAKRLPDLEKGLVALEADMKDLRPFWNKVKDAEQPAEKGSAE